MKRAAFVVGVLFTACKPKPTPAVAIDASTSVDAAPSASASASASPPPAKEPPKPKFSARATGSFSGVVWKPTFATASVKNGEVTIAIFDGTKPGCTQAFAENELQLLVTVPYEKGKKVDLGKLKAAKETGAGWDFNQISLFDLYKKTLAKTYAGSIELTQTPAEEESLVVAKIDLRADAVTLKGDFEALVCLYE